MVQVVSAEEVELYDKKRRTKMINRKGLSFVLALVMILTSFGLAFATDIEIGMDDEATLQYRAPLELTVENGELIIERDYVTNDTYIEIAPYNTQTVLYSGEIADYIPVAINDGEYLIALEEETTAETTYYYVIMRVDDGRIISLGFESHSVERLPEGAMPLGIGERYEIEPDDTMDTAMEYLHDYDYYGRIYDETDVDWYKIKFPASGEANFWLGNIPTGADFDLYVYNSNGTLLQSSTGTTKQELITRDVTANVWYYMKVVGKNGSSSVSNYMLRAKLTNKYSVYNNMGWGYMYDVNGTFRNISSNYGPRGSNNDPHYGFDITSTTSTIPIAGAAIKNVYRGTCVKAEFGSYGEVYNVVIRTDSIDPYTGNNLVVQYMHLTTQAIVSPGNVVNKGAIIGYTGRTGNATGPHLHFQVSNTGSTNFSYPGTINPVHFFSNVVFTGDTEVYNYSVSGDEHEIQAVNAQTARMDTPYYGLPSFIIEYLGVATAEEWLFDGRLGEDINIYNALIDFEIDRATFVDISSQYERIVYDPDMLYNEDGTVRENDYIKYHLDRDVYSEKGLI